MSRCAIAFSVLLAALPAQAAVWPVAFQEFARQGEPRAWKATDGVALWTEYGLETAESAEFKSGDRAFTATAWRFKDATGALAAWQLQRPTAAKPAKGMELAASFPGGIVAAKGNYLIRVEGANLSGSEIYPVFDGLPGFREQSLPSLPSYLPPTRVANSERFVLGEKSLASFLPGWSAERVGLDLGVEVQVSQVAFGAGEAKVAIFRYPTPQLARLKAAEFEGDQKLAVHRSGPLVAVLMAQDGSAVDRQAGSGLLSVIAYRGVVMQNEPNPNQPIKDAANMMLSIFTLAGVLLVLCLVGGLAVGGYRIYSDRNAGPGGSTFQALHLGDR
ncbi:MAG: hypothetical protein NTV70_20270 [Acidobacteria bacterium]|nr:hypothetical protein [Acidobacteriota bacterium]